MGIYFVCMSLEGGLLAIFMSKLPPIRSEGKYAEVCSLVRTGRCPRFRHDD